MRYLSCHNQFECENYYRMANIQILFFGPLAHGLGKRAMSLEAASLFQIRDDILFETFKNCGFEPQKLQMSVNQVLVREDIALNNGDEIAFFTAFSGG